MDLQKMINEAWNDRELLKDEVYTDAIRNVIDNFARLMQKFPDTPLKMNFLLGIISEDLPQSASEKNLLFNLKFYLTR